MNAVDRWFEHTASHRSRVVSLYASLLTGRVFAYFRYRLRYPFLVSTVRFAVHVAEFFIVLSTLGGLATFTVMVLRAGSLIVTGGWWGLLEIMRNRLRSFARSGDRDAASDEVGRWLVLAVILAVVVTAGGGIALLVLSPAGDDPVARIYVFLVVLELALGFPVRTLHSGVYATRRVYKPIWSMFLPTAVQLAALSAGFFFYPAAAIIIAIIASNAITIWVTVHYTIEAYRLAGFRPHRPGYRWWQKLPSIPAWVGITSAVSGMSLRLDAVMVLALVGFYGTDTRTFDLTAGYEGWRHVDAFQFFYLILPLFRGTYESAGIFYFDFVRLRTVPALRPLKLLFFHKLLWAAPVIALFYWSMAAALGLFVLHDVPASFLVALIPLFVVRSLIGIYQIRLFAESRFGTHIATLLLLIGLLWLVWIKPNPASDLLQITAAMVTQLIVLIDVQHLRDRREPPLPTFLSIADWVRALPREPGPVIVGSLSVPDGITTKQRSATVQLLRETFDSRGYFAYRSPNVLVFYERTPGSDSPIPSHLSLQSITGGAVNRGRSFAKPAANGVEALNRLRSERWMSADATEGSGTTRELAAQFRSRFADGIALDLATLDGAEQMRTLSSGTLNQALQSAVGSIEAGTTMVGVEGNWLTPIYRRGELRYLFFVPSDTGGKRLRDWQHTVTAWATAGCNDHG